jgi:tetratricopeptide (TPR) repeat protein
MKYIFFFFPLLFFSGCAHFNGLYSQTDRLLLLDEYVEEQLYGKALELIADTPEDYPEILEIEKRRKGVLEALRSYEKLVISTALKQERANNWPATKQTYDQALGKSGNSKVLKEAQQAMLLRFQRKMDALEHEELIVTGEWLQKKLPLLEELHASDPGDLLIQWRYSRIQNEVQEVAMQLLQLGEQMLTENNLIMAGRTLSLAAKLAPSAEVNASNLRLKKQLEARTLKKEKDRKNITRRKDKKNIESFNKAMAYGELAEARRYLSRLTSDIRETMAVKLMQERLDKKIQDYIQEELSIGNSFYRSGKYEHAIRAWRNIMELEPENEAVKGKLERAEVIVEKVKSLRERQVDPATPLKQKGE